MRRERHRARPRRRHRAGRGGVREVVVAPGSRNAPLSFAAYDAAEAGLLRLHTRIDERTAGFLALGLTKGGSRAAVDLHVRHRGREPAPRGARGRPRRRPARRGHRRPAGPAARHRRQPDHRPGRHLRPAGRRRSTSPSSDRAGSGRDRCTSTSSSTTRWCRADRWQPAAGGRGGRACDRLESPERRAARTSDRAPSSSPATTPARGPGRSPPRPAGRCWPSRRSGARTGPALRSYRLLLATELADQVERVVVFGHPTLSRPVSGCCPATDVEVARRATRPGPARTPSRSVAVSPPVDGPDDPAWLAAVAGGRRVGVAAARRARRRGRPHAVRTSPVPSAARCRAGGLLVVGASSPIRDLDLMATAYEVGSRRKVIANRGLSGIDGTVSTAIGAALAAAGTSSRNLALMGDVTFLHDTNGLVHRARRAAAGPDDRGGQRRRRLDLRDARAGRRGATRTPTSGSSAPRTSVDLAALCAATRTPHWRVDSAAELEHALASPNGGIEVVEAVVDRPPPRARPPSAPCDRAAPCAGPIPLGPDCAPAERQGITRRRENDRRGDHPAPVRPGGRRARVHLGRRAGSTSRRRSC